MYLVEGRPLGRDTLSSVFKEVKSEGHLFVSEMLPYLRVAVEDCDRELLLPNIVLLVVVVVSSGYKRK